MFNLKKDFNNKTISTPQKIFNGMIQKY